MSETMATYQYNGSPSHVAYESYRQEQAPIEQRRRPRPESSSSSNYAPSPRGYREDYSRAQHASLIDQQPGYTTTTSIRRAKSDVGPTVSEEQLRFSAHINRFASHDPRTTPVHTPRGGVSVSERIKRFNTENDVTMRQTPPSPQQYQEQTRRNSPQRTRSTTLSHEHRFPTPSRGESSYRRHQDMAQDHYHSEERQARQQKTSRDRSTPTTSNQTSSSSERRSYSRERRSRSPATRPAAAEENASNKVRSSERSQSPAARLVTESNYQGSPSRASETQRAARSLLAKRRQRRLEEEARKNAEGAAGQQHSYENSETKANTGQTNGELKRDPRRDEGRTDRILREARSRSASPRISRYSRKAYEVPQPASSMLSNDTKEKPALAVDYGRDKRRSHAWDQHVSPKSQGARATTMRAPQIAVRNQEPVSPLTMTSPRMQMQMSRRRGGAPDSPNGVKNSADSVHTSGSNTTSSVQEIKRQLWDDKETLQVSVKPSLSSHGYSDKRTKQTSGYYAPEMAGHQGQRVRSLSPKPRLEVHGHERPASSIDPPSSSAMFNSKFVQAALSSQRDGRTTPPIIDAHRAERSSPNQYSRYNESQLQSRSESPRPPITPKTGEPFRPVSASSSPRAGASPVPSSHSHSIERVPSSAGGSTATGEASVAKLVAKLTSVSREDPERALRMIDSILRAESRSSSGQPGSRAGSRSGSRASREASRSPVVAPLSEDVDVAIENDDDESDDSDSSCDDTSVSSITNPTYQRDDKAYPHAPSTSTSRNPRPSSLNKYSQLQPTSPKEEEKRGKSSKSKKEKKPPPPATIKAKSKKSSSKKEKAKINDTVSKTLPATKVRALSPSTRDRKQSLKTDAMDPAAIAMKIRGWDEQVNLDPEPMSPTKTVDTSATEELGSIVTPKQTSPEHRRAHPWDDNRPQNATKARAIDLTIGTGPSTNPFENEQSDALEPASPWQRRRAAKQELVDSNGEEEKGAPPRSATPSSESLKIAPNVYDVHRNRRRRSRSREGRPDKSRSLLDEHVKRNSKKPSNLNPFDSDYSHSRDTRHSRDNIADQGARNPFDSDYENTPRSTMSDAGNPFESDIRGRPDRNGTKSDTGDMFESAWGALPSNAFGARGHSTSPALPSEANELGGPSSTVHLPPRTPTSRIPFPFDEAPESSLDPNESSGRRRRGFLKMKRSGTPKKDRQPQQPTGSKPLLSPYAMDSVEVNGGHDEFTPQRSSSKSQGRRSRTLSPAPRKMRKSKSPGRNRLRLPRNENKIIRNDSFTDGEDESSSLTGSLTGSTTSSVRNKNLAKKFSRFLKVYEED